MVGENPRCWISSETLRASLSSGLINSGNLRVYLVLGLRLTVPQDHEIPVLSDNDSARGVRVVQTRYPDSLGPRGSTIEIIPLSTDPELVAPIMLCRLGHIPVLPSLGRSVYRMYDSLANTGSFRNH